METIELQDNGILTLQDFPADIKGIIIICPGGAYRSLSPRESEPVAGAYTSAGWGTAVLQYSIRTSVEQPVLDRVPLKQLSESVRIVRERHPDKPVLVCGFSAGGHLAATLGVHWREENLARPDGLILCYPVITAGPYANKESFGNLTTAEDAEWFSIEKWVNDDMPPVFLWHTVTDTEVPVQNSIMLAQKMSLYNVSYELHLYPRGVHGLSLATPEVEQPEKQRYADAHVATWFNLSLEWLRQFDTKGL